MPSLLTLSDVMGTGHHAAVVAKVGLGKRAAVVGDGAVGLCAVIAAKRLGAEQIIIMGRHDDRIALVTASKRHWTPRCSGSAASTSSSTTRASSSRSSRSAHGASWRSTVFPMRMWPL
jgi:D-arabinose 1-dehydrogenase-like Zn-dependent alcohol dehydrogenase